MQPPIFPVCAADPAVTAVLGAGPTRLWPFGEAPQGVALPYAVWRVITGAPENHLGDPPDIDSWTLQVDVYAATGSSATDVTEALRDAIEPHAHIVRWGDQDTDPATGNKHIGFDVSWYVSR
ncbi:DUF3168 domain-containing protein [Halomonas rhizosphaerae]|uniref:DUF3168 domain-containing protein n=1 Tax=Halomonas rhizosphaerae TaxID=3043296 RepID=A0ABT6UYE3_9GAMM|nr:DUF3168 domain-containing protein [Halomonas rhizosphaerae]MDI5890600.1 DUF3168 domain-containing protein [Halomonas rhizosphaerae]